MRTSTLESKTIRPGLNAYSFYRSDRRPVSRVQTKQYKKIRVQTDKQSRFWPVVIAAVVVVGVFIGMKTVSGDQSNPGFNTGSAPAVLAADKTNHCAGNSLDKHVVVSISLRHLWACEGSATVHDTDVITGMEAHEETKTPIGTYKVYAKVRNTTLTGKDSTGSWNDPVAYWMPFLDNKYGTYGFHDATWRNDSAFGQVDPHSEQASHGCIELPLGASKWLYEWAPVGTSVTVKA